MNNLIHVMFEDMVRKNPQAKAVYFAGKEYTYDYINKASNRLAGFLRNKGVNEGTLVGVYMDRSQDMIISMMAILKAGGTYVPLDPKQPVKRINLIAETADLKFAICSNGYQNDLDTIENFFCYHDIEGQLNNESPEDLNLDINEDTLSYVIFTSGSTGVPKGVQIRHRNVINFVDSIAKVLEFKNEDRFLATATVTFDMSVLEIFLPLCKGAEIILSDYYTAINGRELKKLCEETDPTVMQATPSTWYMLIESGWMGNNKLQALCGGESWSTQLGDLLADRCGKLWNAYGPTEATVYVTMSLYKKGDKAVVLGEALDNVDLYIWDENMQPVEDHKPGELYIGGKNVGCGYFNNDEKTEAAFKTVPGIEGLVYKTGDRVFINDDGKLEYIERVDFQVKIRGYRIELGDIENCLEKHESIKQAVAVVKGEGEDKILAVYLRCKESDISRKEVMGLLKESLPYYMIPQAVEYVDEMPMTDNLKVNRRELMERPLSTELSEREVEEAVTDTEKKVAEIWKKVLGLKVIDRNDDFYELGGHSLKAIKALNYINDEMNISLGMKDFLSNRTLSEMASLIDSGSSSNIRIEKAEVRPSYPMSDHEKRMFIAHEMDDTKIAYNVTEAMKVEGELKLETLRECMAFLADRYEILRTKFSDKNGDYVQEIVDKVTIPVDEVTVDDTDGSIEKYLQDVFTKPFDLNVAPLMRVVLINKGAEKYLVFDTHHIILDGLSTQIIMDEIEKICNGEELPEVKLHYKDYSEWFRINGREELLKEEKYWTEKYKGELPVLELPLDYPRPKQKSFKGSVISGKISDDVREKIDRVCAAYGATEYMVMLSAFLMTVSKFANQDDILVGTPVNGRAYTEVTDMPGMFVNTLVLRGNPEGHKTYADYLKEIKDECIDAFSNQLYPLEDLLENVDIDRDISRNPMFDIMFGLLEDASDKSEKHDRKMTLSEASFDAPHDNSLFDLTLDMFSNARGLTYVFEYSTVLFKKETVERIKEHFEAVVDRIANSIADGEKPEQKLTIDDINRVSDETRKKLESFNGKKVEYDLDRTLITRFEEYASKNPDKTAVIAGNVKLSYGVLNDATNLMAAYLIGKGMERESVAGILLERSEDFTRSVMSVWKAGGAYMPMDIKHPADRKLVVLEESNAGFLITRKEYIDPEIIEKFKGEIIYLDNVNAETGYTIDKVSGEVGDINLSAPDQLAYILFTSGSTGKPKGVMIEHKGMLNHILAEADDLGLNENLIFSQNANQCFDVSVWQFFGALALGGTSVIIDNDTVLDVERFIDVIKTEKVNMLEIVPSYAAMMLDYMKMNGVRLTELQNVLVTGEAVKKDIIEKWFSLQDTRVINAYGPAEASDDVVQYVMTKVPEEASIPIGKPLNNNSIYIVDKHMQLCPIGVEGEICVAGIGVGRGYVNQPEKTEKAFMINPFNTDTEERLYKTGDMGKWLPDGRIAFGGREDFQVKIRGFRIELEEIENQLIAIDGISEAVVAPVEGQLLAAYYTVNGSQGVGQITGKNDSQNDSQGVGQSAGQITAQNNSQNNSQNDNRDAGQNDSQNDNQAVHHDSQYSASKTLDTEMIRAVLKDKLPEYMVPSFYVEMESLPLSANGKVDRKKLPKVDISEINIYVAPENETEEELCHLFEEILKLPKIGTEDDFFMNGGHSLRATNLINKIEYKFGVRLMLKDVFENPTVKKIAGILNDNVEKLKPIEKAEVRPSYPMSDHEKRMFIAHEMDDTKIAYNVTEAMKVEGELKLETLRECMAFLADRYEILRTKFSDKNGDYVQEIVDKVTIPVDEVTVDDTDGSIEKYLQDVFTKPFDLNVAPLMRVVLINKGAEKYLVFDTHHIILDGLSTQIIMDEIEKICNGEELPEVKLHYKDYSEWFRINGREELLKEEKYWTEKYKGELPVLELPLDYPRPKQKSFKGSVISGKISDDVREKIDRVCAAYGATEYMVMLSAFLMTVSKFANQDDILVGTPVNGRAYTEVTDMPGMFVNTLVLRGNPEGHKTYADYLKEIKDECIDAFSNQLYPLEDLLENVDIDRDISRNPMFDIMFGLLEDASDKSEKHDRKMTLSEASFDAPHDNSLFDLTLDMFSNARGLTYVFEYSTVLFKKETVERIKEHFEAVVDRIANSIADGEKPEQKLTIDDINRVSDETRKKLESFNGKKVEYDLDRTLITRFEEYASKNPDKTAVIAGNVKLSYGVLNDATNLMAAYLIGKGMERESVAGILLERSEDFTRSVMSVWKAGGAYMPMDIKHPADRKLVVLEESNAGFLITRKEYIDPEIIEKFKGEIIYLDNVNAETGYTIDKVSGEVGDINLSAPDQLAYILFTSGSTGKPKGVMIEHKGMLNHILAEADDLGLNENLIFSQNANQCFDVSVWQFFGALALGGTSVIIDNDTVLDVERFIDVIKTEKVNMLEIVPSYAAMMLDYMKMNGVRLTELQNVLVTGEAVKKDIIEKWFSLQDTRVINAYGPAEASDDVVQYVMTKVPEEASIPIGKPLNNNSIYIVDKHMQLCPIGVEGEICVAGIGVGRGYVNQPEKTEKAFMINPFNTDTEERLYKTGDMGKWLPDGRIAFGGREDFQVKIRGFRIELEEIENQLIAIDGISEAVVAPVEGQLLAAYYTVNGSQGVGQITGKNDSQNDSQGVGQSAGQITAQNNSQNNSQNDNRDAGQNDSQNDNQAVHHDSQYSASKTLDTEMIRAVLKDKLPEYMVPSFYVEMESLPLSANGKVDRKKLPKVDISEINIYVAPENETEEELCHLFEEILKLPKIGTEDDFFMNGGHSLRATNLINKIEYKFGVRLMLKDVFENPTVKKIAGMINDALAGKNSSSDKGSDGGYEEISRIEPCEVMDYYPLSAAQRRMFILNQLAKNSINYNIPFMYRIEGDIDPIKAEEALRTIVKRHASLRTGFEMLGSETVQKIKDDLVFEMHYEDSEDTEEAIKDLVRRFVRPFKLSVAPLFRAKLAKLKEKTYFLMLDIHHIICDGISNEIIIDEFLKLYRGESLPDVPVQYIDYACWEAKEKDKAWYKKQEKYWLDRFEEEVPKLSIPSTYTRPLMQSFEGRSIDFEISGSLYEKISDAVKKNQVTLQMLLMAAYDILLAKYSVSDDIVVGSPVSGRSREELSGVVGMFVNMLAIRNNPSGDKSFTQFLKEVKNNSIDAYENQDYPFDELVEKLSLAKDISRNPIFDTVLNVINIDEVSGKFGDLQVDSYILGEVTSKFDMTWTFAENDGKLMLEIEYCNKIFSEEDIEKYYQSYVNILEKVLSEPEIKISDISVMSKEEEKLVTEGFNDNKVDYPNDILLHELFEEQVSKNPLQKAVIYEDSYITYDEMNKKANSLANMLRDKGVGPDTIVAVMLERSLEMAISLMAVLKSGGAYLPVDPSYPDDRKEYLLEDSKAEVIITDSSFAGAYTEGRKCILIDKDEIDRFDNSNPARINDSSDLAYIIYTSGSTGKPKGVMIEHRNIVNTLLWRREDYGFDKNSVAMQFFSFAFDGFVSSFFTPLVSGSTTFILSDVHTRDAVYLAKKIIEEKVTHMFLVPVLYKGILATGLLSQDKVKLKTVTLGGDRLDSELAEMTASYLPEVEIANEYGPTENSVNSTCLRDVLHKDVITIGKPISNCSAYIVDKNMKPVPVGVKGEICVAGRGVARGYLGREELTKEKFITWDYNGERIYKTGDMGSWTENGEIAFLGRMDNQVKIRGYRIETGEVEEAMLRIPEINESVVIVKEFEGGRKELHGFYVSDEAMNENELRARLGSIIPKYMVPSRLIHFAEMPVTPNGKLDRKALEAYVPPKEEKIETDPPKNEEEAVIAKLFSTILHIDGIGRHDDFFDLGGDSLGMIVLQSKLLERNIKLSIATLYENRTVEQIGKCIRGGA